METSTLASGKQVTTLPCGMASGTTKKPRYPFHAIIEVKEINFVFGLKPLPVHILLVHKYAYRNFPIHLPQYDN